MRLPGLNPVNEQIRCGFKPFEYFASGFASRVTINKQGYTMKVPSFLPCGHDFFHL